MPDGDKFAGEPALLSAQRRGIPGFIQKEYVSIPPALLSAGKTLQKYFRLSHACASALRPRKTT